MLVSMKTHLGDEFGPIGDADAQACRPNCPDPEDPSKISRINAPEGCYVHHLTGYFGHWLNRLDFHFKC